MLSVANKYIMVSVGLESVVMLNVVMLSVVVIHYYFQHVGEYSIIIYSKTN